MITSYSGLLTQLTRLLDGEDVSASEIPSATLAQVIYLGELRIYREIRTRYNEKAWGITTTSNLAALPADFQAASIVHFGKKPCRPVSEEWLISYLDNNPAGTTLWFAKVGTNLQFGPAVADGTTVQGRYFYKMAALDETTLPTNTLFAVAEDLYLYAALAESAPFFGQDARLPMWEAKYQSIKNRLNLNDSRAATSAGRIQRKASTTLMR